MVDMNISILKSIWVVLSGTGVLLYNVINDRYEHFYFKV